MEMHQFAIQMDFALVGLVNAGENLHERRFAGGIVTDEAEDLAVAEIEIGATQRHHRAKRFNNAAHANERMALTGARAPSVRVSAARAIDRHRLHPRLSNRWRPSDSRWTR